MESRVQVARTYAVERVERAHKQRVAAQATVSSDFEVAEAHRDAAGARRRGASERVEAAALLGSGRVANARANRAAAAKARSAAVEARMTFRAAEAARRAKRASIIRAARRAGAARLPLPPMPSSAVATPRRRPWHRSRPRRSTPAPSASPNASLAPTSVGRRFSPSAALWRRGPRQDRRHQGRHHRRDQCARDAHGQSPAPRFGPSQPAVDALAHVRGDASPAAASAEALAATAAARLEALEARLADATARREDVVSAVYNTARRMGSERVLRARRRSAAKEFVVLKRSARRQAVASARRRGRQGNVAAALGSDRVQYAAMCRDVAAERELKAQLLRGLRREDAANRRGVLLKIRSACVAHGPAARAPWQRHQRARATEKNARSSDNKRGTAILARPGPRARLPRKSLPMPPSAPLVSRLSSSALRSTAMRCWRVRGAAVARANRRAAAAARRCMRRMNRVARALQAEQRSLSATTKRQACLQARAAAAAAAAKPGLSPEKAAMVLAKSPTKDAKPTRLELRAAAAQEGQTGDSHARERGRVAQLLSRSACARRAPTSCATPWWSRPPARSAARPRPASPPRGQTRARQGAP